MVLSFHKDDKKFWPREWKGVCREKLSIRDIPLKKRDETN